MSTLFSFVLASSAATTSPPVPPVWSAWETCVAKKAKQFAAGPDAADLVARSTVAACSPVLEAAIHSNDDPNADEEKRAELLVISRALTKAYSENAYDKALAIVIEARSKHAPNP